MALVVPSENPAINVTFKRRQAKLRYCVAFRVKHPVSTKAAATIWSSIDTPGTERRGAFKNGNMLGVFVVGRACSGTREAYEIGVKQRDYTVNSCKMIFRSANSQVVD